MQQPKNQCQDYVDSYVIHTQLGDGGQANVYLGSLDQTLYAIKVYLPGVSKMEAFQRQVEFLSNLQFPNLINFTYSKVNAKVKIGAQNQQERPIIALQFAEGGQLFDYISKEGKLPSQACRCLIKQLIDAIKYLDKRGVSHRDLKPENILFDKNFILKVSDFGLSTYSEGHDNDGRLYSRVGTEGYKPPEMELGNYEGLQVDIFGTGVILFIMYNGTPPFLSTKTHDRIYKLLKQKNYAKFWALHEKKKPAGFYPESFKKLMNSFFSYEPAQRPTFQSLSEDDWLNSDTMMQDELKDYMLARYKKIAENDVGKQKVSEIQKKINAIMEDQKEDKGYRDQNSCEFIKNYRDAQDMNLKGQLTIIMENIIQRHVNVKKQCFINQKPAFVIAWIKQYLIQCLKNGEVFLQCDFTQIKALSYRLDLIAQNEKSLKLSLKFLLDQDSEEQLIIQGKIVQNKDKAVSIIWSGLEGNVFWLNSCISKLNNCLNSLA